MIVGLKKQARLSSTGGKRLWVHLAFCWPAPWVSVCALCSAVLHPTLLRAELSWAKLCVHGLQEVEGLPSGAGGMSSSIRDVKRAKKGAEVSWLMATTYLTRYVMLHAGHLLLVFGLAAAAEPWLCGGQSPARHLMPGACVGGGGSAQRQQRLPTRGITLGGAQCALS